MPKLTLISFENDWCAQCYTQRPIVEQIKQTFKNELTVKVVNVATAAALARQYAIQAAPSLVLLRDGEVVEKIPRFIDQSQLTTLINYYL